MSQNLANTPQIPRQPQEKPLAADRPNETGGLNIDEHIRIFDPNDQKVLLEKRA